MGNSARPVILVVDDNVENLKVIASTLDRYGFSAAVAMNADECFSFLSREKPELILMDVMMPGTDGFDLCAQLKRSPAYKEIPVIFLTARADSEDAVRGLQAGAVASAFGAPLALGLSGAVVAVAGAIALVRAPWLRRA